jgi:hypothetical protein
MAAAQLRAQKRNDVYLDRIVALCAAGHHTNEAV